MGKQSAEKYLDELLNSVNREEKHNELMEANKDFVMELQTAMSSGGADDFAEIEATHPSSDIPYNYKMSPKAEAEFLMEFEKELEGEDYDDFLNSFDENDLEPEDRLGDEDIHPFTDEITEEDALMSMLGASYDAVMEDAEPLVAEEPVAEIPTEMETMALDIMGAEPAGEPVEIPLESLDGFDLDALFGASDNEPDLSVGTSVSPSDPDVVDLGQLGEEDLINLLASTDDLADIGSMLSQSDSELPINGEDPFAVFAESEMSGSVSQQSVTDTEKAKGKEKPAKGGFLAKLSALLFGSDSEEEKSNKNQVDIGASSLPGVEELSDESAQILAAFADADAVASDEQKGGKKGKKDKKEKKEKKAKEPKKKKEPKPKAPKKEKPKKVKEVDNTPPLPKGPVVLVAVLAISILVLTYMGPGLIGYHSAISEAKKLLSMGQYTEAAHQLSGFEIKKEDMMLHGKIATLAAVDSELSMYEVFQKNERWPEALDSLICAAGRCAVNESNSITFACVGEMENLKNRITVELQEQFGITYEKALSIYQIGERDRNAYTRALESLMKELGIK